MLAFIAPLSAILPESGLLALAAAFKTLCVNCKLHLFKSTIADVGTGTTLAELAAAEADYSGYTAGGVTVAAMNDPYQETDGSATVLSPLVQFNYDSAMGAVPNTIGGFYVVTAAGDLLMAARFDTAVTLDDDNSGLPIVFGRNFAS
jgi:hypothetical protein